MIPEPVGPYKGLVTGIGEDGIERAIEWTGEYSSALYRAQHLTATGQYKGARAYACIGVYGAVPEPPAEDTDEPPAVTLDQWGI